MDWISLSHWPLWRRIRDNWVAVAAALSLSLAGVFVVQYGIEQGVFGPWARVIAGTLFGLGLLGGAWVVGRRLPHTAADTFHPAHILLGGGLASLYASAFFAHSLYALIPPLAGLGIMAALSYGAVWAGTGAWTVLLAMSGTGTSAGPVFLGLVGLAAGMPVLAWLLLERGTALAQDQGRPFARIPGPSAVAVMITAWALPPLADLQPNLVLHTVALVALLGMVAAAGWPTRDTRLDAWWLVLGLAVLMAPELLTAAPVDTHGARLAVGGAFGAGAVFLALWMPMQAAWRQVRADGQGVLLRARTAAVLVVLGQGTLELAMIAPSWLPRADGLLTLSRDSLGLIALFQGAGALIAAAGMGPAIAAMRGHVPRARGREAAGWLGAAGLGLGAWGLHGLTQTPVLAVQPGPMPLPFALGLGGALAALLGAARTRLFRPWPGLTQILAGAMLLQAFLPARVAWLLDPATSTGLAFAVLAGLAAAAVLAHLAARGADATTRAVIMAALSLTLASAGSLAVIRGGGMLGLDRDAALLITGALASMWILMSGTHLRLARALAGTLRGRIHQGLAGVLALAGGGAVLRALGPANPLLVPGLGVDSLGQTQAWPILNATLAMPAGPAAALVLAARWAGSDRRTWRIAWSGAGLLGALWAGMQVRIAWTGTLEPFAALPPVDGEIWTYSVVLLGAAMALMVLGTLRGHGDIRRAGSILTGLTIAKVFLVDTEDLTGLMRAGSFAALGLSLLGLVVLDRHLDRRRGR